MSNMGTDLKSVGDPRFGGIALNCRKSKKTENGELFRAEHKYVNNFFLDRGENCSNKLLLQYYLRSKEPPN